jgi:L-aminopeptidase/D-esterase-like protein
MYMSSFLDVPGLKVGHCTDLRRPTGCTVILCEQGAGAAVSVRGYSTGTREIQLLEPLHSIQQVHAILLTGGSTFGLDACSGVIRYLEERGYGFAIDTLRIPIVPAAVLFDLLIGDGSIRPDAQCGYQACIHASDEFLEEGNVGVGAGASVGKLFGNPLAMKGGFGH